LRATHLLTLPSEKILQNFDIDPGGWKTEREVLDRNGPNQLKPPKRPSPWKILLTQILNSMGIVLIAATEVSLATMDCISGAVIAALVVLKTVG
jgi:magnesium-transporting ATPase (P-type)